jgi:hypothetical protein
MLNVTMRRADLSGALFRGCELGGCDLSGSKLGGAQFDECTYSRTGGRYTDAVAMALSALGSSAEGSGMTMTRALAAGLSGEPFAFVYNSADLTERPTRPFTQHPLKAAAITCGHEVEALYDLTAAKAATALTRALKSNQVCLLPVAMTGGELSGTDLAKPFWAVATTLDEAIKPAAVVLLVPPFGERRVGQMELTERWEGPCETLEAAGTERSEARFPLLILTKGESPRAPREAILVALRNAVEIMNEPRTYGTLTPGVAGLKRLADDLEAAAKATDPAGITALAPWAGDARKVLAGARTEAAEFLEQAAGLMLTDEKPLLQQASALFRSEAQLLAEKFPALRTGDGATTEELKARCADAAAAVREMAGVETAAVALLKEVTTGAKQPAGGTM